MPVLGTYQRIVIKGTGPGSEIWQTSFATANTAPPTTQALLQSYLTSLVPYVATWWTAVKPLIYGCYAYTDLVAYHYTSTSTAALFQADAPQSASVGTNATNGQAVDAACVVSLRTAVPGRKTRGRMYVPCHAAIAPATGLYGGSNNATVGTATATMFRSIISNTTGYPAVVSRTSSSYELVTSTVTDNKPDVQRRRENRLQPSNIQILSIP